MQAILFNGSRQAERSQASTGRGRGYDRSFPGGSGTVCACPWAVRSDGRPDREFVLGNLLSEPAEPGQAFGAAPDIRSQQNMLRSSLRRCRGFCQQLRVSPDFSYESTGDGLYVWHESIGPGADVATFVLLVCMLLQTEAMKQSGNSRVQLRTTYAIDSAYMLYDVDQIVVDSPRPSHLTGKAKISCARLLENAQPGQFLVADFVRSNDMRPENLVDQTNGLFERVERSAGTLNFDPHERLVAVSKHEQPWYCWNVCGRAPNFGTPLSVGLHEDKAPLVTDMRFRG